MLPIALTILTLLAWQAPARLPPRPYAQPPDIANEHYGPHERNVLDLWKAASPAPTPLLLYIHGGGFTAGDKSYIPEPLRQLCLKAHISVATINYRYSTQAPYPAPMEDSARALQYLRLHAKDWNLDPKAIALSGESAGAGISLWLGFRDDMAQPAASDPVLRQSTRVSVIGVSNAQTGYDPRFVAKLIGEDTGRHPALARLFGVPRGQDVMTATEKFPLYEQSSAINFLTKDDPPVFLYYSRELQLPPPDPDSGIHSPRFGLALKEQMDKLGIDCIVRTIKDFGGHPAPQQMFAEMLAFFEKHLPK